MKIGNDWDEKLSIVWKSEGFKKIMDIIKKFNNFRLVGFIYDIQ